MKVSFKPGEIYVGRESAEVSTILGSCVSVTMLSETQAQHRLPRPPSERSHIGRQG